MSTVRLADLTPAQRRLVEALIAAGAYISPEAPAGNGARVASPAVTSRSGSNGSRARGLGRPRAREFAE